MKNLLTSLAQIAQATQLKLKQVLDGVAGLTVDHSKFRPVRNGEGQADEDPALFRAESPYKFDNKLNQDVLGRLSAQMTSGEITPDEFTQAVITHAQDSRRNYQGGVAQAGSQASVMGDRLREEERARAVGRLGHANVTQQDFYKYATQPGKYAAARLLTETAVTHGVGLDHLVQSVMPSIKNVSQYDPAYIQGLVNDPEFLAHAGAGRVAEASTRLRDLKNGGKPRREVLHDQFAGLHLPGREEKYTEQEAYQRPEQYSETESYTQDTQVPRTRTIKRLRPGALKTSYLSGVVKRKPGATARPSDGGFTVLNLDKPVTDPRILERLAEAEMELSGQHQNIGDHRAAQTQRWVSDAAKYPLSKVLDVVREQALIADDQRIYNAGGGTPRPASVVNRRIMDALRGAGVKGIRQSDGNVTDITGFDAPTKMSVLEMFRWMENNSLGALGPKLKELTEPERRGLSEYKGHDSGLINETARSGMHLLEQYKDMIPLAPTEHDSDELRAARAVHLHRPGPDQGRLRRRTLGSPRRLAALAQVAGTPQALYRGQAGRQRLPRPRLPEHLGLRADCQHLRRGHGRQSRLGGHAHPAGTQRQGHGAGSRGFLRARGLARSQGQTHRVKSAELIEGRLHVYTAVGEEERQRKWARKPASQGRRRVTGARLPVQRSELIEVDETEHYTETVPVQATRTSVKTRMVDDVRDVEKARTIPGGPAAPGKFEEASKLFGQEFLETALNPGANQDLQAKAKGILLAWLGGALDRNSARRDAQSLIGEFS